MPPLLPAVELRHFMIRRAEGGRFHCAAALDEGRTAAPSHEAPSQAPAPSRSSLPV
jgi:hypothetical protein